MMNNNLVIYAGVGFILGLGIGSGVTYILTKKKCDQETQMAINEMKEYYKEKESKKVEETKKEETEEDFVRKDKPSISEISSIVNSDNDSNIGRTHYSTVNNSSLTELKNKFQEEIDKEQKTPIIKIISETEELAYEGAGYEPLDYTYDADSNVWLDSGSAVCDIEELPFDSNIVEWVDERCSLVDHENHALYLLERVM